MELPNLPRVLKKRESKIDTRVLEFLLNTRNNSFALEVKMKGGVFKKHQLKYLKKVANGKHGRKMSDSTIGKLDFDAFGLIKADAIKVICEKVGKKYICDIKIEPTKENYQISL